MNKYLKKFVSIVSVISFVFTFSIVAFAEDGQVRYPLTPTITPIRIFFAVLVVILFVAMEIGFEKLRNYRINKRNKDTKEKNKNNN